MRLANRYNRFRHGRYHEYRRPEYERHFDQLIAENGVPEDPVSEMGDGWAVDS